MQVEPNTQQYAINSAPTIVDHNSGQNSIAAYQTTMTASTYQVSREGNSPQYVILSSNEK
jgi:hypothetical protein